MPPVSIFPISGFHKVLKVSSFIIYYQFWAIFVPNGLGPQVDLITDLAEVLRFDFEVDFHFKAIFQNFI